jgi:hypothetical protein
LGALGLNPQVPVACVPPPPITVIVGIPIYPVPPLVILNPVILVVVGFMIAVAVAPVPPLVGVIAIIGGVPVDIYPKPPLFVRVIEVTAPPETVAVAVATV